MKLERARELYSDYAEESLSPALRLAMDQHFAAEPDARADYAEFTRLYSLLDTTEAETVEVPTGLRARILEKAAAEQARREADPAHRAALSLTGWFRSLGRRRATGGVLAALATCAVAGVVLMPHNTVKPGETQSGSMGIGIPFPLPAAINTTLAGVTTRQQADGMQYTFLLHLPASVPSATVSAYVLTDNDQITEPDLLAHATPALTAPQSLTNTESMQIPVTLLHPAAPGTTLNMLVQWTSAGTRAVQKQVIFTPTQPGAASPAPKPLPANADFYDTLQAIAADDGVTVIADATTAPTQSVSVPTGHSPAQALTDLQTAAAQIGDIVQQLPGGAYLVSAGTGS